MVTNLPVRDPRPSWGDVDGDGDLDLFTASTLLRNDRGTFVATPSGNDFEAASAWGDYDNDGDLDVALAGGRLLSARLLRNDGGTLIEVATGWDPVLGGLVAWGDADNDGDLDVAICGREVENPAAFPRLFVYRNDGGVFVKALEELGAGRGSLQWGDVNRDGRADLLFAGATPDGNRQRVALNLGGFRFYFLDPGARQNGITYPGAAWFDLDSDGDLDLAGFTANASFLVLPNDGYGSFGTNALFSANVSAGFLRYADFDRDGDFDVVVAGRRTSASSGSGTTLLYRNARLAPPAPTALESVVDGNDVELRWPRRDDFGLGSPNTYNLRVGTAPGLADVVSPLADPSTSRRRVADFGNMGHASRTRLRALRPGTYYWSVQPIDSAWNGGPFAPEARFVIASPLPPSGFRSGTVVTGNMLEFVFAAPAGHLAIFESSPRIDAMTWSPLETRRVDATGLETLRLAWRRQAEFFRLRVIP
ncbi:MAG: VCBS repeat-containing protein [Verrucomicrobiales bacterium]|nr:VCBS repeat-containing protein [Verrucomicrobiales bacterium]